MEPSKEMTLDAAEVLFHTQNRANEELFRSLRVTVEAQAKRIAELEGATKITNPDKR